MYWAWVKLKSENIFEKALQYSVSGTLAFFLFSSFKGRVEVNWTLGMLVPLTILALRYYKESSVSRVWLVRLAWVSMLLILLVRIHLITPLDEFKNDRAADFHGHKEFAKQSQASANGLPLVAHRYQTASSLWFYTGKPVPVLNLNSRFSQFDLWKFDSTMVGKRVAYINTFLTNNKELTDDVGLKILDPFPGFKFLDVDIIRKDNQPQIHISWNKPLKFYSFTDQYPIIVAVEMKNEAGQVLLTKQWTAEPTAKTQTFPILVPPELRSSTVYFHPYLKTTELGIIRRYKVFKLE
jgi:hypothetical protein